MDPSLPEADAHAGRLTVLAPQAWGSAEPAMRPLEQAALCMDSLLKWVLHLRTESRGSSPGLPRVVRRLLYLLKELLLSFADVSLRWERMHRAFIRSL